MKMTVELEPAGARSPLSAPEAEIVVSLAEGAVASWPIRTGRKTFEILHGTVWFTCEKRAEDFLLHEGERLTLSAPGKVVAQSLVGCASIAVREL